MSNEAQAQQQEQQYVIGGNLLQQVLNILGEMPLKDSLQTYMSIQQGVRPLEEPGAATPDAAGDDAEKKPSKLTK